MKNINEFLKSRDLKTKDLVLFVLFVVFFIYMIIMVRTANYNKEGSSLTTDNDSNTPITDTTTDTYNRFDKLKLNNYNYIYTININDTKEIVSGKIYNNKELFSIISNIKEEYEKISSNYLKLENGNYISVDTPRDYFKYIDISFLEELTDISDKTKDGSTITYTIDITDLFDKYNPSIEYDGFTEYKTDKIVVTLDGNFIKTINIDYSNYYSYITNTASTLKLDLEFSNFGTIEDFEI